MNGDAHPAFGDQEDPVQAEAAAWFARLRAETASASDKRAFRTWLRQSRRHVAAFRCQRDIWREMEGIAADPEIMAMRSQALASRAQPAPTRWGRYSALAASLVAVFSIVAASIFMDRAPPAAEQAAQPVQLAQAEPSAPIQNTAAPTVYRTGTGQRSTIDLPDGSSVELNTDTVVQVNYSAARRELVLLKGEAFFDVETDPSRPFVVAAGGKNVTAIGTAFTVRLDNAEVRVTMVEGVVTVTEELSDAALAEGQVQLGERLVAGEQLLALGPRSLIKRGIDTEVATSWRSGRLIFDNEPLSQVLPEFNRYTKKRIEIGDEGLADMRVSGSFRAGSTDRFAQTLAVGFPVRVEDDQANNRLILRWKE